VVCPPEDGHPSQYLLRRPGIEPATVETRVQRPITRLPSHCIFTNAVLCTVNKPGIEQVQALTEISRSALCCHSNETHAPIAKPPNSAQLEGTPTIPPTYIGVRAVVWECGEVQADRHTDRDRHKHTQTAVTTIHFASSTTHARCNHVACSCNSLSLSASIYTSQTCHIFLLSQLTTLTIHNSLSLSLPAQDLPFS